MPFRRMPRWVRQLAPPSSRIMREEGGAGEEARDRQGRRNVTPGGERREDPNPRFTHRGE